MSPTAFMNLTVIVCRAPLSNRPAIALIYLRVQCPPRRVRPHLIRLAVLPRRASQQQFFGLSNAPPVLLRLCASMICADPVIHLSTKPFVCFGCQKPLYRKDALNLHVMVEVCVAPLC